MSDQPRGPGWWQAGDGRWYPPEQWPAPTPAPPGPPAPSSPPSGRGYWIGALVAGGGLVVAVLWLFVALVVGSPPASSYRTVVVPSSRDVQLDAGIYELFDKRPGGDPAVPPDVRVTGPNGAERVVPWDPSLARDTYVDDRGDTAEAFATLSPTVSGVYRFEVAEGRGPSGEILVGPPPLTDAGALHFFGAILLGLGCLLAGGALIGVTAWRRSAWRGEHPAPVAPEPVEAGRSG